MMKNLPISNNCVNTHTHIFYQPLNTTILYARSALNIWLQVAKAKTCTEDSLRCLGEGLVFVYFSKANINRNKYKNIGRI